MTTRTLSAFIACLMFVVVSCGTDPAPTRAQDCPDRDDPVEVTLAAEDIGSATASPVTGDSDSGDVPSASELSDMLDNVNRGGPIAADGTDDCSEPPGPGTESGAGS